jgi:cytochrome c-type biogenesis protein CcmH
LSVRARHARLRSARRALLPFAILAAVWAACASPALAQSQNERPPANKGPSAWHPEALEAIDRLKSPYCPGFMLEVCPSPQAAALRDTIAMLAEGGMKADSIVEWMLAGHGEEWLALPPARGRSLIAWIVPPAAVLLGIGAVVVVLRRLRRPGQDPLPDDVSPEESARLEAAIRELETEEEPLI